ncbi:MAG: AarF/ABC1/UbiB kinase family protein [Kofleriaceae bacterium]|nr:AarF/ABC1/UbiB kinase family protein [Kofleriaceae bacterium]
MSAWSWLAVVVAILVAAYLAFRLWVWRTSRRRNDAGIVTEGRGLVLGTFVGRRVLRRAWMRVRMLVASRERRKQLDEQTRIQSAAEAAKLLGGMKGVFMKLGQIVSFAHDALPDAAKVHLQALQKDAPPMAFDLARQVIEEELGGDLGKHFKHVDENPLAAASIGQVHRARLRDGTDVVIKVQYPGVDAAIEGDLAALGKMTGMAAMFNRSVDFPTVLAELRARVVEELDYRREARNQALFRRLWDGHPMIRVPRVHAAQTTKRVLTSEFVRGFGFYDFIEAADAREKLVASATISDFVFDSMFCHLVYNGDPHPGNYLFHEDGAVTFLDFGCVKRFSPAAMADLKRFFRAILEEDRATHDEYVVKLGLVLAGRDWDHDRMWEHWRYHLEPYWSGDFAFTPEYLARGRVVMSPENTRDMNLPPDLLFFTRITFGLNAISQKLGSAGNFNKAARRHFYVHADATSALGLAGVVVPEHFRHLPQAVRPGQAVAELEASDQLPSWDAIAEPAAEPGIAAAESV